MSSQKFYGIKNECRENILIPLLIYGDVTKISSRRYDNRNYVVFTF